MEEHARALAGSPVGYFPYLELEVGAGKGLLEALAAQAAVVVTDDAPVFFLPRMRAAAAAHPGCRMEAVDGNGVLPLAEAGRDFTTAFSFRRHMQKRVPMWLGRGPNPDPLSSKALGGLRVFSDPGLEREVRLSMVLGTDLLQRWAPASDALLADPTLALIRGLDRTVAASPFRGGTSDARSRLDRFLEDGLHGYVDGRNHPDAAHATGLSPHLHWGHISVHEILFRLLAWEGVDLQGLVDDLPRRKVDGRREGWWQLSPDAEAFLDQLVTWRELGYHTAWFMAERGEDPEAWESLPAWARGTLMEHAADPRPYGYTREAFEAAETHDPLWNAAQRQLREEGVIQNYLRMLWGKKILEWSESPQAALETMIELNHRWAVDGRDPNSTSGITWVLGRYDRGWPERAIYGKVRSMSSDSTRRKVELRTYLRRFGS
jgi:deoxyribodipyrimidine photo-lyase